MTEIIQLSPQDAAPERAGSVLVMRQFGEDDPRARVVTIEVIGAATRTVIDGDDESALTRGLDDAKALAAERGLERIFVIDRTASPLAQAAVEHDGDRTTASDRVLDTDEEDGERGPDMRDRLPT